MRIIILLLFILSLGGCRSYQKYIQVTNIKTEHSFKIKRGDSFKCNYTLFGQHKIGVTGRVKEVTDSTLIYQYSYFRPLRTVSIDKIQNIDRIPFSRYIIPSIVTGAISGGIITLAGSKNTPLYVGILSTSSLFSTILYVNEFSNRRLRENVVGKVIRLQVFQKDLYRQIVHEEILFKNNNSDTLNIYYKK